MKAFALSLIRRFSMVALPLLGLACGGVAEFDGGDASDSETFQGSSDNFESLQKGEAVNLDKILGEAVIFREKLELFDVEFADGLFVAVGSQGGLENDDHGELGRRSLVLWSTDGQNWKEGWSDDSGPLLDVAYSASTWLAVGRRVWPLTRFIDGEDPVFEKSQSSLLLLSKEGQSWQRVELPTQKGLSSVVLSPDGFVAASDDSAWLLSPDEGWRQRDFPPSHEPGLQRLVRSGSVIIAHAYSEANALRSVDGGESWEAMSFPEMTGSILAFWATPEGFAGTSQYGGREKSDLTSADGAQWKRVVREGADKEVGPLEELQGAEIEIRNTDEDHVDLKTADASWTPTLDARIHALVHGSGVFVVVGLESLYWSVDGETWQPGVVEN